MQLLFRQGAGNCLLQFPAEVLQVPVRINVQKFQLFLTCFWDCFKKLTPAVGKTADQDNIFDPAVCTIPITLEHPSETMEKFYRIIPAPSGSVIIQDDRWFSISPAQVDPHIGF